jgi:hypothetical protein
MIGYFRSMLTPIPTGRLLLLFQAVLVAYGVFDHWFVLPLSSSLLTLVFRYWKRDILKAKKKLDSVRLRKGVGLRQNFIALVYCIRV